jgi:putative pyruvate formate lyase activating enzyme
MLKKALLPNYFGIIEGDYKSKYLNIKNIKVTFSKSDSIKKLWEKHEKAIKNPIYQDLEPKQSLLDLKIYIADKIFQNCIFCENKCKINRNEKIGKCNTKDALISSEFIHIGEEQVLIPSHTIFFSGCTFKCIFCQNWDISQRSSGYNIKPDNCANIIKKRNFEGARNVNWVGGDPTPNILYILKVLKNLDVNIPQIWNSNMYCSNETMDLLNGMIDLYLTDFKYGNNNCANKFSKIDKYFEIITRNHKIAYKNGDIIVRHLILPNHFKCCTYKILKWIKKEIPNSIVNLMDQYHPDYLVNNETDINRTITKHEYDQAIQLAKELDINLI